MRTEIEYNELNGLYRALNMLSEEIGKYNKQKGIADTSVYAYHYDTSVFNEIPIRQFIREINSEISRLDLCYIDDIFDMKELGEEMQFEGLENIPLTDEEVSNLNFIRLISKDEILYNRAVKILQKKYL